MIPVTFVLDNELEAILNKFTQISSETKIEVRHNIDLFSAYLNKDMKEDIEAEEDINREDYYDFDDQFQTVSRISNNNITGSYMT
jgi:hypothetical protein